MRTLQNLFHSTVVVLTLIAASSIADASPAELERVMSDYWAYRLAENPMLATSFGVAGSNHELPRVTPADEARRLEAEYDFLARAKALDTSGFDDAALMNRDLLIWVLNDSIDARQLGLERIPFNSFSGFFTGALRASRGLRYTSVADYEDYIARLSAFPRYFDENIANMRRGIDDGFV
ncbi:MAG: DUF885 family protein, partial [Pseudomonadota bacterium]